MEKGKLPAGEEWRDIAGFEGIYLVSDKGRVYSVPRKAPNHGTCGGYCLKPQKYRNGYVFYPLTRDGKTRQFLAHRLVAEAFVPNPNGYGEINHKDGDKENNTPGNLEWCTRSQNNKHAVDTGLRSLDYMHECARKANMKPLVFHFDGREMARFPSAVEASIVTGISRSAIRACAEGRNSICDGYEVSYADD